MSTIGNWIEALRAKLSHLAPEIDPILSVLEVAQAATGLGGAGVALGIKLIESALAALASQQAGALTHDQLVARLAELKAEASTQIAAIEADQDAALDAKFPAGPPTSTGA